LQRMRDQRALLRQRLMIAKQRDWRHRGSEGGERRGEIRIANRRPARGHAREIGAETALDGIERILREGGAPARQRAVVAAEGVDALLDRLVSETQGAPCPS